MICYALTSIQVHPKSECKRNQQCTPLEWSPSATETVDFRLMSWRVTVLMSKIYILMVYACKHTKEKKKIKITSSIKSVYYPGVCSTLLSTNSISALTRFRFFLPPHQLKLVLAPYLTAAALGMRWSSSPSCPAGLTSFCVPVPARCSA